MVSDAGYGTSVDFREKLTVRGIPYVVGIQSTATLWPPGKGPLPPTRQKGEGGPPTLLRWDEGHRPVDALTLARDLPKSVWETVTWREGTKGVLSSRFARVTIRAAHRDCNRRTVRPVEWLLIEWPEGDPAPTKYWLSTMPPDTSMEMLVRPAKVRWRIERDHEELNQEFGLDQFEGRGRRGFHHHATRCIAAYGFRAAERARLSPLGLWRSYRHLDYPEALLVRPERHVSSLITTFRLTQARASLAPASPLRMVRKGILV